jgi:hypothetical protein
VPGLHPSWGSRQRLDMPRKRKKSSAYRGHDAWMDEGGLADREEGVAYLIQRTILSQWFLFLVPDLKILRLHIVSVLCVSGALVDLEFPFSLFLFFPISLICLSLQPPILFFSPLVSFPFCRSIPFTYPLLLLPSYTRNSHFFLCYSQLIWTGTFRFDKKSNPTLIIFACFLFLLFLCLRIWPFVQATPLLSFANSSRKTHQKQQISLWC